MIISLKRGEGQSIRWYIDTCDISLPRLGDEQCGDLHVVIIVANIIKNFIVTEESVFAYLHWKTTVTDDDKLFPAARGISFLYQIITYPLCFL